MAVTTTTMIVTGGFGTFPPNELTQTASALVSEAFPELIIRSANMVLEQVAAPTLAVSAPTRGTVAFEPAEISPEVSEPATATPEPTPTATAEPTHTSLPSVTPEATPTSPAATEPPPEGASVSCSLVSCAESSGANPCIYGFAPSANNLMVTFRIGTPIDVTTAFSLTVDGEQFHCSVVREYPDRLYCLGKPVEPQQSEFKLTVNNQVCSAVLAAPKYVTPVPSPSKKPGQQYP